MTGYYYFFVLRVILGTPIFCLLIIMYLCLNQITAKRLVM